MTGVATDTRAPRPAVSTPGVVGDRNRFYDVQQFVEEANRVTDLPELNILLRGAANTFGFDYFALVHHIDLSLPIPSAIRLYNYPDAWVNTIIERSYFSDDPMLTAAQRSAVGFRWSDVSRIIELTGRHKEILAAAGHAGMGEGFTIPAHVPGEYHGSCSFGTRSGRSVPDTALPAVQYIGCFAFEAARRITRLAWDRKGKEPASQKLTQRQFDCVVLVARGKSDVDVAQLLGISSDTVHQHIEDAKRRYNVATRMQLVVRTLFDSRLTFADILGSPSPK